MMIEWDIDGILGPPNWSFLLSRLCKFKATGQAWL